MDLESWKDSGKTFYELAKSDGPPWETPTVTAGNNCEDSEVGVSTCPKEMRVPRKFLSKIVYLTYEGAHSDALDT